MTQRHLLVTSALPYANGSIHLGHMVETIQADIWVRFQKLRGHRCMYMCADDAHGTPVMLSAKRQGVDPEQMVQAIHAEHLQDFKDFLIEFDHFYTTHSPENQELAAHIFKLAQADNAIEKRAIEQYFCPSCQLFLPDRLIRGTCPHCKAEDQYGDACEKCASTYAPTELMNPRCAECGSSPILKSSEHYFFKLKNYESRIQTWMDQHVPAEVKQKMQEWFKQGLKDWDISRDAPYFGFLIPGTTDKYFYVWLDAPVGYMATTLNWCKTSGASFDDIWKVDPTIEIHHFIGKDILYFHTLFWPAMLLASGYKLPTRVHVHGFLTVNGEKMSKSRGTFINARAYLTHLEPEYLRYYFASKLGSTIEDLDLNLEDFVFKVNADIVNKVVNIASRLGSIVHKKLNGKLTKIEAEGANILAHFDAELEALAVDFDGLKYAHALRKIMSLAELANKYIDEKAPWALVKTDPEKAEQVCTAGLNMFRFLIGVLKPILPNMAQKAELFLNCTPITWSSLTVRLENQPIHPYEHLANRVELATAQKMVG